MSARTLLRLVACSGLLLAGLAQAAASPLELQKKARARMKSLDFEAALPLLEQLRDLGNVEPALKAQGLVDLGITFVNLGRPDDARRAFDAALEANPEVPFPASAPPKIRKLFDEAKDARSVKPEPPPAPVVVAPPVPLAVAAEPSPKLQIVQLPVTQSQPRMTALPLILLGAGALAIGAGVSTAYASQNATRILTSALHSSTDAQALQSRRGSMATASLVCYGAGAALGLAGAAVFAFSGPGLGRSAVAVVVTPDLGAISVRGDF